MPTLNIPQKELRKHLTQKLTEEKLAETITQIGTDLEEVGENIIVEIFPNRPDLLSTIGLARAINQYTDNKYTPTYTTHKSTYTVEIDKSAEHVRPQTRCFVAKGIPMSKELLDDIIRIQEKLHITHARNRKEAAIGIYPLEHITFPITLLAKKPEEVKFIPLGKTQEMNAEQIVEENQYGKLLEKHSKYPLFVDATNTIMSMPPLINSARTGEVTKNTTDIFVEVSGTNTHTLEEINNILACALSDHGAEIYEVTIKNGNNEIISPDLTNKQLEINPEYLEKRSGIAQQNHGVALKKMGITLHETHAEIPPYRADYHHQIDLVEDILIGYGYNNLTPTLPNLYTEGKLLESTREEQRIRETLNGLGFTHTMTYTLSNQGITLTNPLTEEYSHLRENILGALLNVLHTNLSSKYPQNIYDIGPVFRHNQQTETGIEETTHIAAIQCSDESNYTTIRQALETLATLHEYHIEITEHSDTRFIPGRCAQISGDLHGIIGELHPEELANRGIMHPASAFEIYKK